MGSDFRSSFGRHDTPFSGCETDAFCTQLLFKKRYAY